MNDKELKEHIRKRGWNPWVADIIHGDGVVYFPLYSLSGKFSGVQQYRPEGIKKSNCKDTAKYWTHVVKGQTYFFLPKNFYSETLECYDVVFVQEGIFSCLPIAACGFKSVAILTSDNKAAIKNLRLMGYKVVSILEGDAAGNLMKSHLDFYAQLNIGDVGDVYQEHGIDVVYTMCMDLVRLAKGV